MTYVWILTEEYNDYDQHGEYFLAVFKKEPTEEDLKQFDYDHFGRENNEYSWVNKHKEKVN
jgi:hypothetical protein